MNKKELKNKIYDLTNNKDIFIKETPKELTIWASTDDSELYTIYMNIWLEDSFVTIRNYQLNFYIRGKGLGAKFYKLIEEYIKYLEYKEIRLHLVLTGAENFWKKVGFIHEDIWRKYI